MLTLTAVIHQRCGWLRIISRLRCFMHAICLVTEYREATERKAAEMACEGDVR